MEGTECVKIDLLQVKMCDMVVGYGDMRDDVQSYMNDHGSVKPRLSNAAQLSGVGFSKR